MLFVYSQNGAFSGDFTAVLAKHSKHSSLQDSPAIGADRMQLNFGPALREEPQPLKGFLALAQRVTPNQRVLTRIIHERTSSADFVELKSL